MLLLGGLLSLRSTTVEVGWHDTVPHAQTWSRLRYVSVANGTIGLHGTGSRLLGQSKWGAFFQSGIYGVQSDPVECVNVIDQGALVNMLTWQVGHLLVDILEPLYYARFSGELYLRVANPAEIVDLSMIQQDTPFALLRLFGNVSLELPDACFRDLLVELDVGRAYYATGDLDAGMRERYSAFKSFLNEGARSMFPVERHPPSLVLIRRTKRVLTNFRDVQKIAKAEAIKRGLTFRTVSLEDEPFSTQLAIFDAARVVVAQYGTAAHNVLFMRPGTLLVLLVQPGWCPWAWHFVNQAILSQVDVVTVCEPNNTVKSFRWAQRAWRAGPWIAKDADWPSNLDALRDALSTSVSFLTDVATGGEGAAPRVHVSDVRVERDGLRAKVMLVPEVVGDLPDWFIVGLERNQVQLCVEGTCFSHDEFNEFSTLDLRVDWGDSVRLRCWLQFQGEELMASETYWASTIDGTYPGLQASTVTHSPPPPDEGRFRLVDWRVFEPGTTLTMYLRIKQTKEVLFEARLDERTALQSAIAEFCRTHDITDCFALAHVVRDAALFRLDAARHELPTPQSRPSPSDPCVFLHNEKTAGSSLRRFFASSALNLGVGFYVPCYDDRALYDVDTCYGFDLSHFEGDNEVAVLAGHFQWGVWDALPRSSTFTCFTMVRHPVDRALSLYYERVYSHPDVGGRLVNDLDAVELEWLLREFKGSAFSRYRDEGMCNTMCKMLLGLNVHKGRRPDDVIPPIPPILNTSLAIERLGRCVVGVQDDWRGTMSVLEAWFPWLRQEEEERLNAGYRDKETRFTLRPELRDEIEKCNTCDLALYSHALELFETQLKILRK